MLVLCIGAGLFVLGVGMVALGFRSAGRELAPVPFVGFAFAFGGTLVAFGLATALSTIRPTKVEDAFGVQTGTVRVQTGPAYDVQRPIQGPGSQFSGSVRLTIGTKIPAVTLVLAAVLMALATVAVYRAGVTTVAGIAIMVAAVAWLLMAAKASLPAGP